MTMRMGLDISRGKTKEELKDIFNKNVKMFKEVKVSANIDKLYVFITSSNKHADRKFMKFEVNDLDLALDRFIDRATLQSKRLFVALGVDYEEGSKDIIITGTDYTGEVEKND